MNSRKWSVVNCDKDTTADRRGFLNVCVSIYRVLL